MDRRRIACALAVVLAALPACDRGSPDTTPTPTGSDEALMGFGGTDATLTVEVADDDDERARGLMGRTSLADDAGMVFVWTEPTTGTFWMKDTLIPLSIAFWDEDGTIVAIHEMAPCKGDPCPTYEAPVPYVAAAEAPAGWFAANGIAVGDAVEFPTP
jgi:uncharacterized membrane protein (UPF0127 family)